MKCSAVQCMSLPFPEMSRSSLVACFVAVVQACSGFASIPSDTLTRALHVTYIGDEFGLEIPRPLRIEIDANAALGFLNNTANSGKHHPKHAPQFQIEKVRLL